MLVDDDDGPRGALDYLTKPADADEILRAFAPRPGEEPGPGEAPSVHRVEWEHIQRVLAECGGNVSRAARVLGVHRRSLQRKLATRPAGALTSKRAGSRPHAAPGLRSGRRSDRASGLAGGVGAQGPTSSGRVAVP